VRGICAGVHFAMFGAVGNPDHDGGLTERA
jgi:hypothetical protein